MQLDKEQIVDILYGATFFGGGGGGSLKTGLNMLEQVPEEKLFIELVSVDDMDDDGFAAMSAGLGSPLAIEEQGLGDEAVYVVQGMMQEAEASGNTVKYIYSGEQGGFNTMVPLYSAMMLGMPVLDTDGNGRAVPELNTGLLPIYGIPISPLVLASKPGDIIVGRTSDPFDSVTAEKIARQMSIAFDMSIGFSTWLMDKEQVVTAIALGQLSLTQKVGHIFRDDSIPADGIVTALEEYLTIREFARGTITEIDIDEEGGFDIGLTIITTDSGEVFTIDFKNENLIIRNATGEALLVVPEIISLIDLDNKMPLPNTNIEVGQHVSLVGVRANERWWAIPEGFDCWANILRQIGYVGGPVPLVTE